MMGHKICAFFFGGGGDMDNYPKIRMILILYIAPHDLRIIIVEILQISAIPNS